MQCNILEYLEETVQSVPDKTAFFGESGALTFRQLSQASQAIGSRLHQDGFYKQPVAVFMKKQPKTVAAFLGAVYAGCFYVPLDDEMPRHRIKLILQSLQPAACICDGVTIEAARGLENTGRIYLFEEIASGGIDDTALRNIRDHQIDTDPIYIVFTSGSTGVPKGVVGCHRAVIDYIENLCEVLKFNADTVFGNQTPLYFDACLKEIIPTLKYGAATCFIPKKLFLFPVQLVAYLNRNQINTLCWVVSALTFLSACRTFDTVKPEYLHTVAFASEVFPIRQLHIWQSALPNARFINLYGPTETTGICCYYEVDREFTEDEALPIGRPFRNTDIILLDDQNRVPPAGEEGEICIRGSRLTHGYFSDSQRTLESFVQNPLNKWYPERIYRTGDIGKYNARGELVFLGRKDYQIKHMGHRIELGEIEVVAAMNEEVNSACAVFDTQQSKIILYFVGEASERELMLYLKEKLPRYMVPHIIRRIDAMPLTPNGKTDRNLLMKGSVNHA